MLDFLRELTGRKVWLFGGIYLALGWVLLQVAALLESTLELPNWIDQAALVLLVVGFPVALLLAWAQESGTAGTGTEEGKARKPGFSLAILALNNLSDDRELDWVCDGLAEDIITRLGTAHCLNVAARNSSFAFKGEAPDIRKVGDELDVRYVVEGSIRIIGDDLRVTAQLIDTETGAHVWSDNFDYRRDAIKVMQNEVIDNVSSEVLASVLNSELDRLLQVKGEDLSVIEIVGLCWAKGVRNETAKGTREAIELLKRGIKRFPEAADLRAECAYYCCNMGISYDRENRVSLLEDAQHHIEEAIRIAPRSQPTLWRQAGVLQLLGQPEEAARIGEQLERLYPNAITLPVVGISYLTLGECKKALEMMDGWLARCGSSHFDERRALGWKGNALLGLGNYGDAELALRQAVGVPPQPPALRSLVVALAHQGKLDEARVECEVYKGLDGAQSLERTEKSMRRRFRDPAFVDMFLDGLKTAGLE